MRMIEQAERFQIILSLALLIELLSHNTMAISGHYLERLLIDTLG